MAKHATKAAPRALSAAAITAAALALAFVGLAGAASALAAEADYAREQRWAQEITPAILVGEPLYLKLASGREFLAIYTGSPKPRAAVVVVHGLGLHPDWGLVNALRSQLPDAGYATLSVQMPVLAADAPPQDYAVTFPEAAERLRAAVGFLQARGHDAIAIVAHSLGARMSNQFLIDTPRPKVLAWVSIGLSGEFSAPERIGIPTLDLYAERDLPAVLAGAPKRSNVLSRLPASAQVQVSGADHFFTDHQAQMLQWVRRFLDRSLGGAAP
jgi:pimeloyl-ACP methyl ester carboxylesterase